MSDRELLRHAAIACGELIGEWVSNEDYLDGVLARWNPLTDDGDALRLAVKLNLRISIEAERAGVITVEWNSDGDGSALSDVEEYAPIGGDDYAATRRAITRAAAEIGKAMP